MPASPPTGPTPPAADPSEPGADPASEFRPEASVVNLRRYRKQQKRLTHAAAAAENRVRFGRTRAEKERDARLDSQQQQRQEGHRLDKPVFAEPKPSDRGLEGKTSS